MSSITEPRPVVAELAPRLVVRHRCAAEREAAVAAARAAGDLARLVEADADAALGERQRTRAAGDAATDHGHLGASLEPCCRAEVRARSSSHNDVPT